MTSKVGGQLRFTVDILVDRPEDCLHSADEKSLRLNHINSLKEIEIFE